ncbi:MAG: hypothetical protein A2143_05110 [Gallionellales bacterium RBG_16_57_15]|nr:MAG: hypothetical protein A2143_05110 [Gallionellales bacterium RBG_16_57_15]
MAAIACNHWDLFVFCQLAVAYGIGETDHHADGQSGDETQLGLHRQQGNQFLRNWIKEISIIAIRRQC